MSDFPKCPLCGKVGSHTEGHDTLYSRSCDTTICAVDKYDNHGRYSKVK